MWDRFRQRDGTIPILDRKKLEAWQNAHSSSSTSAHRGVSGGNSQYRYVVRGGPAPRRSPSDTDYHPIDAQPHQDSNYLTAAPVQRYPASRGFQHGRPVSSVYSQPSPSPEAGIFAAHHLRNDAARPDPLEISPPSSPDIASPRDGPYPGDVSPIEELMETPETAFQPSPEHYAASPPKVEPRSNIPMMRRERRKNSDAAMRALREAQSRDRATPPRPYGHDVRWDPRTGEPTTSAKGRSSQVNPQEYAHNLVAQAMPAPLNINRAMSPPNNAANLSDRLRRVRQTSAGPPPESEPAPRPEWRGASGRAAIVAPVRDNKYVPPLKIPPRSERRAIRVPAMLSPIESTGSGSTSSPRHLAPRGPSLHEDSMYGVPSSGATTAGRQPESPDVMFYTQISPPSTYPTPPLSEDAAGRNRWPVLEPTAAVSSESPISQTQVSSNIKATRRKPTRTSSMEQYTAPQELQHNVINPQVPISDSSNEWTQPASRFSVSTYATTNHTSTPRVSNDEFMPPPLSTTPRLSPPPNPAVSVLDRGRPIASNYEDSQSTSEPVKIHLESPFYTTSKPSTTADSRAPRALANLMPEGNQSVLSVVSTLSPIGKSLPPAPPEASAKDRVTELNAHLEALGNRRININTAIRKMTELMPTDNVMASEAVARKRESEKRKVEALRAELADIDRHAYEIGLKLHRAYKRLDRDGEYEPTTLWVRRVTG